MQVEADRRAAARVPPPFLRERLYVDLTEEEQPRVQRSDEDLTSLVLHSAKRTSSPPL